MALIDLLYVVAIVLIIFWLVGLVAYAVGPLIYILLVIAIILVIFRLIPRRRV
jgi:hypothetical protein